MTEHTTEWDPNHLPDASGKTFVVTGGNAGIGYFISEQLASAGATVIIASRNEMKARLAIQAVTRNVPHARLDFISLDLASLESAGAAGEQIGKLDRVDGLILNAAALAQNQRKATSDGYEFVLGTNHYGNARLAAAALPHLARTAGARVVTMGSVAQRVGRISLHDREQRERKYRGFRTYGTAKLAQMLFALELDRRLRDSSLSMMSLIAHPGGAVGALTPDRAPALMHTPAQRRGAVLMRPFVQGKDRAAWPAVRAALDPDVNGGQIWGPGSATGSRPPRLALMHGAVNDRKLAKELWQRTTDELNLVWDAMSD
ncbi:SDR family NAD(P)-dependent oxidoreductase [Leucobacter celer]|uniref:SDR family NAD(P)-dependent oxidoreductase n=1 Tax=Leucobacter celer TaxID=668625 RepID=UPI0006A7D777|nr:SDR family NAD(P)-dependent oxidoreductase [Leucobacter celer]